MASGRPEHRNGDYERLFRQAEDRGWRIKKTNGHFATYCPTECGKHIVAVSATPSDHRSLRNTRAQMRKCMTTKGWG